MLSLTDTFVLLVFQSEEPGVHASELDVHWRSHATRFNPRATYPRETFNHLLEALGHIPHLHSLKMASVAAEMFVGRIWRAFW
jgi:hypothetical protein